MPFSTVEQALEAIASGEMVIVVDDEDRENEGDIVVAADRITNEHVAFMMRHARGLICVPLTGERLDQLDVPLMVARNSDSMQTAFTVSVDYIKGTTTGISAEDRATTIRALVDPDTSAGELARPGHIFPLRANPLGVLGRPGHTEAAVDLARLAGLAPAGVICEIANDDGTMARLPQLLEFAIKHELKIVTIEALIKYRQKASTVVTRFSEAEMPTRFGDFRAITYREPSSGIEHIALTLGQIENQEDVLIRVHSECLTGEVFRSSRCDCGDQLDMALRAIQREGAGCLIYLRGQEGRGIGLGNKIAAYALQDRGLDTIDANSALGLPIDARRYGAAVAILSDLDVKSVNVLTNNPGKIEALRAGGVDVTGRQSLIAACGINNLSYLLTKRDRLGQSCIDDEMAMGTDADNAVQFLTSRIAVGIFG